MASEFVKLVLACSSEKKKKHILIVTKNFKRPISLTKSFSSVAVNKGVQSLYFELIWPRKKITFKLKET